ncbi:MAG: regulatory protein RecX [Lachnospiraceae bacterium]|nr:regulatory protein RecX [Lachnospiraceae bacterium]
MMVLSVTSLDRKRSKVLFDQGLALILHPGELKAFHIEEGRELSREGYEALVSKALLPRAKERVLRALMVSDKTEEQLQNLLSREGYPVEAKEAAIAMAKEYGYVDDEAYGARYVESQAGRKSRRQLALDMQRKGFSHSLVQELLDGCPIDEEAQIRAILEKKGYRPEDRLDWKTLGKLAGMLARKGYSYEAIGGVLKVTGQDFD